MPKTILAISDSEDSAYDDDIPVDAPDCPEPVLRDLPDLPKRERAKREAKHTCQFCGRSYCNIKSLQTHEAKCGSAKAVAAPAPAPVPEPEPVVEKKAKAKPRIIYISETESEPEEQIIVKKKKRKPPVVAKRAIYEREPPSRAPEPAYVIRF